MSESRHAIRADAASLRRVRAVLRHRDRPTAADLAYRAYMAFFLALVVAAPVVRGVVLWLSETLSSPGDPLLSQIIWIGALVLAVSLPIAGWYAAPVRISLPEIDLLFTSVLPRWRLLLGRVLWLCLFATLAGAAFAGLLPLARALRGEYVATALAAQLGGGALAGLLGALILLFGQLLHGTRWQSLRDQATRLDAVSTLVVTGEFRGAASRIGAPVTIGRDWTWARGWNQGLSGSVRLFVLRDLLGIARTPARSLAALLGLLAAGSLVGLVVSNALNASMASTGAAILLGAFALLVAYAAIGPWCRGLRAAGEAVGGTHLLPFSASATLLRHLLVPAALAAIVCGVASVGTAWTLSGGATVAATAAALLAGGTMSACTVALRLLGALKGPLPQRLLAPIPTPMGDFSSVNVLLWNLDGPILAVAIGAGMAWIASVAPAALLFWAPVVLVLLVTWCGARLRAAEGR